jgi:hypothetical protein
MLRRIVCQGLILELWLRMLGNAGCFLGPSGLSGTARSSFLSRSRRKLSFDCQGFCSLSLVHGARSPSNSTLEHLTFALGRVFHPCCTSLV